MNAFQGYLGLLLCKWYGSTNSRLLHRNRCTLLIRLKSKISVSWVEGNKFHINNSSMQFNGGLDKHYCVLKRLKKDERILSFILVRTKEVVCIPKDTAAYSRTVVFVCVRKWKWVFQLLSPTKEKAKEPWGRVERERERQREATQL